MVEDMAVTLSRLEELTTTTPEGDPLDQPLRLFGYEVVATLVTHIRALEKRIGELEAQRDEALREHTDMMWQRRRAEEEADVERQRRESAEEAAKAAVRASGYSLAVQDAASPHFSRYASESDNPPKVAG